MCGVPVHPLSWTAPKPTDPIHMATVWPVAPLLGPPVSTSRPLLPPFLRLLWLWCNRLMLGLLLLAILHLQQVPWTGVGAFRL